MQLMAILLKGRRTPPKMKSISGILTFLLFLHLDLGPKTHTRLVINDVIKEDSGNYTCSAPNTVASSIDVFVSPG